VTFIEIVLVIGLLIALYAMAMPNFMNELEQRRLPESSRRMRSLLTLVRANAMYDGMRYRVRFPQDDELDSEGGDRQPLIEREDEPFLEPGVYNLVTDPWARGDTLLRGVRCAEVRLGRPTLETIEEGLVSQDVEDRLEAIALGFEDDFPPLYVETDGTSEWATFLMTDAPKEMELDQLAETEEFLRIEVILDGITGLIWLQRPFYDEELDMFREYDWPPVLRRDFIRPEALTKEQVLEISDTRVRS
jgi:hypothetical protein